MFQTSQIPLGPHYPVLLCPRTLSLPWPILFVSSQSWQVSSINQATFCVVGNESVYVPLFEFDRYSLKSEIAAPKESLVLSKAAAVTSCICIACYYSFTVGAVSVQYLYLESVGEDSHRMRVSFVVTTRIQTSKELCALRILLHTVFGILSACAI